MARTPTNLAPSLATLRVCSPSTTVKALSYNNLLDVDAAVQLMA